MLNEEGIQIHLNRKIPQIRPEVKVTSDEGGEHLNIKLFTQKYPNGIILSWLPEETRILRSERSIADDLDRRMKEYVKEGTKDEREKI